MQLSVHPSIHPSKTMNSYWNHHFQYSTTELFLAFVLCVFITQSLSVKNLASSILNIPTYFNSVQSLSHVHSMPGLPVHHKLLESTQTRVH